MYIGLPCYIFILIDPSLWLYIAMTLRVHGVGLDRPARCRGQMAYVLQDKVYMAKPKLTIPIQVSYHGSSVFWISWPSEAKKESGRQKISKKPCAEWFPRKFRGVWSVWP